MPANCSHLDTIREVTPSARGCEECLKTGSVWVHLRLCRTCGHVGCCDDSPNRHATEHFHATGHPIIEGYDPPRGMGLVLYRRDLARSLRPCHAAARSNPTLLLMLRIQNRTRWYRRHQHTWSLLGKRAGRSGDALLQLRPSAKECNQMAFVKRR